MRIFIAQCNPILGDFDYNLKGIFEALQKAKNANCDLVVFPELAICGYNPEDLLLQKSFVKKLKMHFMNLQKLVQTLQPL